jgi:starch synthase
MRILFVASEGLPFSKTGGLADVVEALPKALVASGHEVAVVLPRYRGTQATATVVRGLAVPMGAGQRLVTIAEGGVLHGVRYFFVDDPEYFDREQLYGTGGRDYPDNAERFAEFSRACIELAKRVWKPEVIHCHDWQSALLPVLLRTVYADDPAVRGLAVVFTIHNMGYQGLFPKDTVAKIGLPDVLFQPHALEYYDQVSYLKGGLIFSDYLTTVSRKYAQEIQTTEYGCGLEGVVQGRGNRMVGILNGVDYAAWSPENDALIAARYSASDLAGKRTCKKDLLAQFQLPADNLDRPLVGIVSRFADQKGFDLLEEIADELLGEDLALVALGTGEAKYEKMFRELAQRFPAKLAVKVAYDNTVAHKIEAGADMFLMPSRYEPCGLNQIYSLRYGTVPVVRATGGLDDTIEPYDPASGGGTGFKFEEYTGAALLGAVRQALAAFGNQTAWRRLQTNGMAKDFSWRASAAEYARLYEQARTARIGEAASASK